MRRPSRLPCNGTRNGNMRRTPCPARCSPPLAKPVESGARYARHHAGESHPLHTAVSHPDSARTIMQSIDEFLKKHRITEVEAVIPDMAGVARGKIIPRSKFETG